MVSDIVRFVASRWHLPGVAGALDLQPLPGGLESTVVRVRITPQLADETVPSQFVVKHLQNGSRREADVYRELHRHLIDPPMVQIIAVDVSANHTHLYLEDVPSLIAWPWADARHAGSVCRTLARLHDEDVLSRVGLDWNYEEELARSAEHTLRVALHARDRAGRRIWRRLGDLRRVVNSLRDIRQRLLCRERTVIHGDVHTGNVIVRGGSQPEVLFIDWAPRASGIST